jgi:hypothetical protein
VGRGRSNYKRKPFKSNETATALERERLVDGAEQ